MSLTEEVWELLDSLGTTADEVADTLRRRGIVGVIDDCHECPIANLVAAEIPGAATWPQEDFAVDDITVRTPEGEVSTTDAVHDFIEAFDNWCYVDLVDPRSVES